MSSDSFGMHNFEKYLESLMYMNIVNAHVYVSFKYIMCFHPHMHLDFLTSVAQSKVEFKTYLGQSLVDYMCI